MPRSVGFFPQAKTYLLGSAAFLMQCMRTAAQTLNDMNDMNDMNGMNETEDNVTLTGSNVTSNTTDVGRGIDPGLSVFFALLLLSGCIVLLKCASKSKDNCANSCAAGCCCAAAADSYVNLN